jgi:hypothetical protein
MEKRLSVGDKTYVFEYTRASICKAEEVFGVSFLKVGEWKTFEELNRFTEALMYAGLLKHNKDLKVEKMGEIHEILTGEDGYDEESLLEGLTQMLGDAINPTGGSRKKFLKE